LGNNVFIWQQTDREGNYGARAPTVSRL
jgi:hypothetical protein